MRNARRLVVRELNVGFPSPTDAFAALTRPRDDAFLLESVGVEADGRYAYVGVNPSAIIRGDGRSLTRCPRGDTAVRLGGAPIDALKTILARRAVDRPIGLPPFCGGLVGTLGWRVSGWTERLPSRLGADKNFPDLLLGEFDDVVAFDNQQKRAFVMSVGENSRSAKSRVDALVKKLLRAIPERKATSMVPHVVPKFSSAGRAVFLAAVKRALAYIRAGDVFQVVISHRFSLDHAPDGFAIYRALRALNPSPYLFYIRLAGRELIGASPEALVSVRGRKMSLRPIAGTRPRGATANLDATAERELFADPKERAEHVMLVDLARNDVGRVSKIGTVRVEDLMQVERYSHVMHLVSRVRGMLRPDVDALDALMAAFPAGTVSGAPKIRAMEIIDELEGVPRGPYAGGVGYFSDTGDLDLALTIRTLMKRGSKLFAQAGAGIVAGSRPSSEWLEVQAKAAAVLRAVEIARGDS